MRDYQNLQAEITEARERLERAQAELDALKQPPPPPDVCWMPKDAIELYHFAKEGRVYRSSGKIELKERATQHILRKTREEAERDLKREQARMTIIRFIARENAKRGWVADGDHAKFFAVYNKKTKKFSVDCWVHAHSVPKELLGDQETIEASINQHRAEYLLYLGVDND